MSSRRGISAERRARILVDTTFLLPALGIGVEEDAEKAIQYFRKFEVYYLEVGLLEAMWKVLKIVPAAKLSRVRMGITAIRRTYHLLVPRAESFVEAYRIYQTGHRDYIDALHYAVAKTENIPLLTIDRHFIDFLKEHGYPINGLVYTPRDIEELLRKS